MSWALLLTGSILLAGAVAYLLTLAFYDVLVVEARGVLLDGGSSQLCLEIADHPDERAVGLSGRKAIGDFDGMVFVFPERPGGISDTPFWMRDTLVSLDIAFVGTDSRVIEVVGADPCEADCPLYAPAREYLFVAEMRRGEAAEFGIWTGTEVWLRGECIPFDRD